jgi:hypothetical protein
VAGEPPDYFKIPNTISKNQKKMSKFQDFGFQSEDFTGKLNTIPYCQFLCGDIRTYGLAITKPNAEISGFKGGGNFNLTEYQFNDGTTEQLYITQQPRLVILNRSGPLMTRAVNKTSETIPYDKKRYEEEQDWKAYSYVVIWLLDNNNRPLSELPFRLKSSGYAGLTFLKHYSYYSNPDAFCKKFLQVYKTLTGDRTISKNDVFYAHAVYQPQLIRAKATSKVNGQSSFSVQTESYLMPSTDNFGSLIVRNGSEISEKIKQFIDETKAWLKTDVFVETQEEQQDSLVQLTPSPNVFSPSTQTSNQQELADQIVNDALIVGWTKEGLDSFLLQRYQVAIANLNSLPEKVLTLIYNQIQEQVIKDMYCPESQQTEIPF